jgi:hypothetical protein
MTKTSLNPDEIASLIITELRKLPNCAAVKISVHPVTDPAADSNWRVEPYLELGAAVHRDCKMRVIALQGEYGRQYDAIWPTENKASDPTEGSDEE